MKFMASIIAFVLAPTIALGSYAVPNNSITSIKLASSGMAIGDSLNVGVKATVSANAMTVTLTQNDGTTAPSSGSPAQVSFRNATATTGGGASLLITTAPSIVVPSGASLGQTSAVAQYVFVYLLNDAGTPDLCVSGIQVFGNSVLNSSTAITSGATSGTVLYCSIAHTGGKPTVLVARLLVTETTAGTWASAPSGIDVTPKLVSNNSPRDVDYGPNVITSSGGGAAKGTTTADHFWASRIGSKLYYRMEYTQTGTGTNGSGTDYYFGVPVGTGCTIDTTRATINTTAGGSIPNSSGVLGSGWAVNAGTSYAPVSASAFSTTQFRLYSTIVGGNTVGPGAYNLGLTTLSYAVEGFIPCLGWYEYGP